MCSAPKISAPKIDLPKWSDIEREVQNWGKNIEKAGQRAFGGAAQILSGNWNNADKWLLEMGAAGLTGGTSMLAGYKAGQSAQERKVQEAEASAQADYQNAVQAAADAQTADIKATITGMVDQRKRSPGRQQTLLGSRGGGTLLG